jgi:hypothetical protein
VSRADNTPALLAATRRRSDDARQRTLEAIEALTTAGAAVTPTAVARQARVSRQWLYASHEARDAIRAASTTADSTRSPVPTPQQPSLASWQRRVETLTDDNQRLRRRVQELEERLASVYGQWRCQTDNPT